MTREWVCYLLGVACLALVGFFSPAWYLGFLPLGLGLCWAGYDLVEVADADTAPASPPG